MKSKFLTPVWAELLSLGIQANPLLRSELGGGSPPSQGMLGRARETGVRPWWQTWSELLGLPRAGTWYSDHEFGSEPQDVCPRCPRAWSKLLLVPKFLMVFFALAIKKKIWFPLQFPPKCRYLISVECNPLPQTFAFTRPMSMKLWGQTPVHRHVRHSVCVCVGAGVSVSLGYLWFGSQRLSSPSAVTHWPAPASTLLLSKFPALPEP